MLSFAHLLVSLKINLNLCGNYGESNVLIRHRNINEKVCFTHFTIRCAMNSTREKKFVEKITLFIFFNGKSSLFHGLSGQKQTAKTEDRRYFLNFLVQRKNKIFIFGHFLLIAVRIKLFRIIFAVRIREWSLQTIFFPSQNIKIVERKKKLS